MSWWSSSSLVYKSKFIILIDETPLETTFKKVSIAAKLEIVEKIKTKR